MQDVPLTRRALREQENATALKHAQLAREAKLRSRLPLAESLRLWAPGSFGIVLLFFGGMLLNVLPHALRTAHDMHAAASVAYELQTELSSADYAKAGTSVAHLKKLTNSAHAQSGGILWSAVEHTPGIGPNLHALRISADAVNTLTREVAAPLTQSTPDSLALNYGRIDVDAVRHYGHTLTRAQEALKQVHASVQGVDHSQLLPQVASALDGIEAAVRASSVQIDAAHTFVDTLPTMLGATQTRTYLLVLSEDSHDAKAAPLALMLLSVHDGTVSIGQQVAATDLPKGLFTADAAGDTSATPAGVHSDLARTAKDGTTYWEHTFNRHVDGVLTLDTVGMGYLLGATGPVSLPDDSTISSANISSRLSSDFATEHKDATAEKHTSEVNAATASLFGALQSGTADKGQLVNALTRSVAEHHLQLLTFSAQE